MLLLLKKNLQDFDRILQLNALSSSLLMIFLFFEVLMEQFSFGVLLGFLLASFLFRTYYFSLKRLQYTYWTLSAVVCFIILFFLDTGSLVMSYFLITLICLKIFEGYLVSSPIYYPFFNWWEYDFRYRSDLVAEFNFNNNSYEGRITDIRRNAACLTAFEKLPIGAKVIIRIAENENNALTIEGKVVSTRETSLGRGFTYGVSFANDEVDNSEYFGKMRDFWQQSKMDNKREKFESSNQQIQ